jgi:acetyl-CoA carboxylase biotin carboxyl carrier protein
MNLSEIEILHILKMLEESSFGELRLETGDLKLLVRKKGYVASCTGTEPKSLSPVPAEIQVQKPVIKDTLAPDGPDKSKKVDVDREGTIAVRASMLGVVYLRPSPDMPPYVAVGSLVKADDTVCLIEIMKVFTAMKSGVDGYITEILIASNEMVEYGQPLFLVTPATESSRKNG